MGRHKRPIFISTKPKILKQRTEEEEFRQSYKGSIFRSGRELILLAQVPADCIRGMLRKRRNGVVEVVERAERARPPTRRAEEQKEAYSEEDRERFGAKR